MDSEQKRNSDNVSDKQSEFLTIGKNGVLRYKTGVIVKTDSGAKYQVLPNGEWRKIKAEAVA